MSSAISFKEVRKTFSPATKALDDIDLEIMWRRVPCGGGTIRMR